ncbi:MAG: polyphenol oxidase family protein [Acidimicrobiia bacterium]|nr:polyphenol oxidase family protein [Acidimicrobiia bacterium]
MIQPPGSSGVAFSESDDGDLRGDAKARQRASAALGIPGLWASLDQIHGNDVVRVTRPGSAGAGDAVWTSEPGLPLAVFTADCFGVVLRSSQSVGVAHAGWRGVEGSVVGALRYEMESSGLPPDEAYVGPGIGPCCFEVGPEVSRRFPNFRRVTSWGSESVDLPGAIASELEGLAVWTAGDCTHHDPGYFSHRRDDDARRLAAIGWVP